MGLTTVIEAMEACEATSSRNLKLQALQAAARDPEAAAVMREFFDIACNPHRVYGIRLENDAIGLGTGPGEGARAQSLGEEAWAQFLALTAQLEGRQLTGTAARTAVDTFLARTP